MQEPGLMCVVRWWLRGHGAESSSLSNWVVIGISTTPFRDLQYVKRTWNHCECLVQVRNKSNLVFLTSSISVPQSRMPAFVPDYDETFHMPLVAIAFDGNKLRIQGSAVAFYFTNLHTFPLATRVTIASRRLKFTVSAEGFKGGPHPWPFPHL